MTFYVGQRVCCVDDGVVWMNGSPHLKRGEVYTICRTSMESELNLWLAGVQGGWSARRFRPLVEDRKSVSFTAGAPKDSEKWDNRKKDVSAPKRVRVNT
jgi:hypothetical protein